MLSNVKFNEISVNSSYFQSLSRIFRIEFNHRHLDYFTEIDGVLVEGIKYNCDKVNSSLSPINHNHHHHHRNHQADKGPIQRRLESVQFKPLHHNNHQDLLKDFLMRDLENFIAEINCGYGIDVPDDSENSKLTLKNLPVSFVFSCSETGSHLMILLILF